MNLEAKLTRREAQVAELIAWGASRKIIADKLFIDLDTVVSHTRKIFKETDVHSISELSAWWFCTHYHISLDFSPIKRSAIIFAFLALVISTELTAQNKFVRVQRTSRVKAMKRVKTTRRRNDNELDLTSFFD